MTRVLVADDDAISLRFLEGALQQLGHATIGAANLTDALAAAADSRFELLLLDRNMPGGGGVELLAALRERGVRCAAIATSAELTAQMREQLQAAGFVACIEKPLTLARLQETVRPWLRDADAPVLDDSAGLTAIGGDRHALQALRMMLTEEVSALHDALMRGAMMSPALLDRLHRLRASCGFCGAPKLAAAAIAFEQALRADRAESERADFVACCAETLAVLHA